MIEIKIIPIFFAGIWTGICIYGIVDILGKLIVDIWMERRRKHDA